MKTIDTAYLEKNEKLDFLCSQARIVITDNKVV